MLLIVLSSFLLLFEVCQSALPKNFIWPILNLLTENDFTQNISLGNPANTSYIQMETTDYYVSRLTANGKLQIYNITSGALRYNAFSKNNSQTPIPVLAYDLLDNQTGLLAILSYDNQGYLFNLYQNGTVNNFYITDTIDYNFNGRNAIQMMKYEFLFCTYFSSKATVTRRKKGDNWGLSSSYATPFGYRTYNIKVCHVNNTYFKVAMWKRNCYIIVLNCSIFSACKRDYLFNSTECNSTEYNSTVRDRFKVAWSSNCSKIIFEAKNQGLKLVNLTGDGVSSVLGTFPVANATTSLNGFWFLDSYDQFLGVSKPNGSFEVYNISSRTLLDTKVLPVSNITAFSRLRKSLLVSEGDRLWSYKFGCDYPMYILDQSGLCIYNTSYVPPVSDANTTVNTTDGQASNSASEPPTDSTINQTDSQISNHTSDQSDNQTNDQWSNDESTFVIDSENSTSGQPSLNQTVDYIINQILNNATFLNMALAYSNQSDIENSPFSNLLRTKQALFIKSLVLNVLSVISKPVEYVTTAVQVLPFTFLYIGFVNFWAILSMYKLSPIQFPEMLAVQIQQITSMINQSLFWNFGWEIDFDTKTQEKFNPDLTYEEDLSSNFLLSNIESFIIIIFSYFVLALMYLAKHFLPSQNFVRKKLKKIIYRISISGQFVGIMNAFFFNLPIITKRSWQDVFQEKINIILQNFFFAFSIFVSCLLFFIVSETVEKKSKEDRKIQKLTWFFDTQCNCLLPIAVMFDVIPLFLAFNALFFCIPIYLAWKEEKFRIIFILKSLYLQFFNTGVILICILNLDFFSSEQYDEAKVIVTYAATLIIGIGAAHEVLELVIQVLYDLYLMLKSLKNKISNWDEEEGKGKSVQNEAGSKMLSTGSIKPLIKLEKTCKGPDFVQQTVIKFHNIEHRVGTEGSETVAENQPNSFRSAPKLEKSLSEKIEPRTQIKLLSYREARNTIGGTIKTLNKLQTIKKGHQEKIQLKKNEMQGIQPPNGLLKEQIFEISNQKPKVFETSNQKPKEKEEFELRNEAQKDRVKEDIFGELQVLDLEQIQENTRNQIRSLRSSETKFL